MKTILIGAVSSSKTMLESMIATGFPVTYVFSLDEKYSEHVSGYQPIHEIAERSHIPYQKFHNINEEQNIEIITKIEPDYIFVVGLSQLVGQKIMDAAKIGVVGFHPTPLPQMRGRAANVWQMLLGIHRTKCSMFMIDEGIDSGDILGQEEYIIEDTDYAADVEIKINDALGKLAKKVLKKISDGTLEIKKQKEEEATYLLKRTPEDGWINWGDSIEYIHRLVRAVSRPFPGAYAFYDKEHKIIIWKADLMENRKYIGIPGQIADIKEDYMDIVCRDGILRVTEYENVDQVKLIVGHKLKGTTEASIGCFSGEELL
jgi:methionyl-tRNA formyltransferase